MKDKTGSVGRMYRSVHGLIILALALWAGCSVFPSESEETRSQSLEGDLVVKYGTSFGMCIGYCYHEIQTDGEELLLIRKSFRQEEEYPEQRITARIDPTIWAQIRTALDFTSLQEMEETYGCPDCADGGAEWIEVKQGSEQKKITFEYNGPPDQIAGLTDLLRSVMKAELDRIASN